MAFVQCEKFGHTYDKSLHSSCPHCGVGGFDLRVGPTEASPGVGQPDGPPRKQPLGKTEAAGFVDSPPTRAARGPGTKPAADGKTRAVWNKRLGDIDPVVGWLVCIEGPDKGRDFRIHTEDNHIGRDPGMDIVIPGDDSVSHIKHARIRYNPRNHVFKLLLGDGRGIVYLNDDDLDEARQLNPYDRIEIGETKLLFVPFCGEHFTWPVDKKKTDQTD